MSTPGSIPQTAAYKKRFRRDDGCFSISNLQPPGQQDTPVSSRAGRLVLALIPSHRELRRGLTSLDEWSAGALPWRPHSC